jgi:hypothetical protein
MTAIRGQKCRIGHVSHNFKRGQEWTPSSQICHASPNESGRSLSALFHDKIENTAYDERDGKHSIDAFAVDQQHRF